MRWAAVLASGCLACETGWTPQGTARPPAGVDPFAPWVVATVPARFTAIPDGNIAPLITFDRPMDPSAGTIDLVSEQVPQSYARVWSVDGKAVALQPASPFALGRSVRITLGADMQSGAGTRLSGAYAFVFFVGDPTRMPPGPSGPSAPCDLDVTPPAISAPTNRNVALPAGTKSYTIAVLFNETVSGVNTGNVTLSGPVNGMLSIAGSGASYGFTLAGMRDDDDYVITAGPGIADACSYALTPVALKVGVGATGATGTSGASGFTGSVTYSGGAHAITQTGVDAAGTPPCLTAPAGVTGSVIRVTGSPVATISRVAVNLKSNHPYASDIEAWLRYDGGGGPQCAILVRDKLGDADFLDFTFSDGAPPPAGIVSSGTFSPETPLSVFNGLSPNGSWTLFVNDDFNVDTGTLLGWTLRVFE